MKNAIVIMFSLILYSTPNIAMSDSNDDKYWSVIDAIEAELSVPFRESETSSLYERRNKLRELFSSIPPIYALHFKQLLEDNKVEVSNLFNYKLATVTRYELQMILTNLDKSYADVSEAIDSDILEKNIQSGKNRKETFEVVLSKMKNVAYDNKSSDKRTWRYMCWFDKFKNKNVDDRIIEWKHICNRQSIGTFAGTPFSTSCKLVSKHKYISESEMFEKIKTVSDVDSSNVSKMMSKMKKYIINFGETNHFKYNLPVPHDEAQRTISVLSNWAKSSQGLNSMPIYYRHIWSWIQKQQKNPLSLYSCY